MQNHSYQHPFRSTAKQTSIFITAGFPHLNSLPEHILSLQRRVDFIEVGMPFSDPVADGPVIQRTSQIALQNGMHIGLLFSQLREISDRISVPIVLMGYLNPVLQYGLERFLQECAGLKIRHLILPDLSPELFEARYRSSFQHYGVSLCFLVTPSTPDDRIRRIATLSQNGFVYLVGDHRITGGSYDITSDLQERYRHIRTLCGETPLFLGFGIDSAEKKTSALTHCDGVIIGSSYLKAIENETVTSFFAAMHIPEKRILPDENAPVSIV